MNFKDMKLTLNKTLLHEALKKAEKEFKLKKCKKTILIHIVLLLALGKKYKCTDVLYAISSALNDPSQNINYNHENRTIRISGYLLAKLEEKWEHCAKSASDIVNIALALYVQTPLETYTSNIAPLYTIVGSKNIKMQCADDDAVSRMGLQYSDTILIDACCATGALFWGLSSYPWKGVILNDLDPERTNFLNVLLRKPFQLINKVIEEGIDHSEYPNQRRENLAKYRNAIKLFKDTSPKNKPACDVTIATYTFLLQCLNKKGMEDAEKIFSRIARFLPAHLKLLNSNVKITMVDAADYLKPLLKININHQKLTIGSNRLVLFDPPYICSEKTCNINGFNYPEFHDKAGRYLMKADYPFLYHCRSSAPKSSDDFSKDKWENILKNKLGEYFFGKKFYLERIRLKEDTELIISKTLYNSRTQFIWNNVHQNIL